MIDFPALGRYIVSADGVVRGACYIKLAKPGPADRHPGYRALLMASDGCPICLEAIAHYNYPFQFAIQKAATLKVACLGLAAVPVSTSHWLEIARLFQATEPGRRLVAVATALRFTKYIMPVAQDKANAPKAIIATNT